MRRSNFDWTLSPWSEYTENASGWKAARADRPQSPLVPDLSVDRGRAIEIPCSRSIFMIRGILHHPLKIDNDNGVVANDPGIVAAWQQRHVAGTAVKFRSVIHSNPEHAGDVILEMGGLAARRLGDRLYGCCPSPTGFKYGAADGSAADFHQFQPAFWKLAYLVRPREA